jgi:sulfoxide reductase heme-binding subunit YedZ
MLPGLIASRLAFRLLLAIPAMVMIGRYAVGDHSLAHLLDASGEWAARMLIVTLAVSPVRLLIKQLGLGPHWPMWLFKRRRDLGVATFLYASLHLGTYLVRQNNIHVILYDLPYKEYLAGWAGFALLAVLMLTSNDTSVHTLGTWWKTLQRLSYIAALAVVLHWFWIRLDHMALYAHVLPLVLLEAYRVWYNFARPAGMKH